MGILIEFEDAATFDKYMGLKSYLNDLLGTPIDRWVTLRPLRTRWVIIARGTPYTESMRDESRLRMTSFDTMKSA